MDRIGSVAAFVEVAERRSFTAAARRLARSPAAVTRAVGELETRLGVRLLNRTTRAVSLTEAGEQFLAGARRVLADLEEIERAAAGEGVEPRGALRVTAPILFGRLHVLPIVTEFLGRFADVSVALILIDRPVELVEEGLDVAVRIGVLAEGSARCATSWSLPPPIWRNTAPRKRSRISAPTLSSRSLALPALSAGYFVTRPAKQASP
jgi:DNA-binding transcriptional LysR family regulator